MADIDAAYSPDSLVQVRIAPGSLWRDFARLGLARVPKSADARLHFGELHVTNRQDQAVGTLRIWSRIDIPAEASHATCAV